MDRAEWGAEEGVAHKSIQRPLNKRKETVWSSCFPHSMLVGSALPASAGTGGQRGRLEPSGVLPVAEEPSTPDQSFPEYDQKLVYLKDTDTEDVAEYSAQSKKFSMQPDWPQNPSLLTTPPVRMAVPIPVPPVRMLETNQATTHNPAQGETSGRDPADRSPVISQGSLGHEEGNPSRLIERVG